ncbi:exonuclease domain-containing protein [Corynebacterium suedekumii]|nr:exonuclease domain-containing protein [Corynebacterium suedekumii]
MGPPRRRRPHHRLRPEPGPGLEDFLGDLDAARRGEAPVASTGAVPGLNLIGFDVETANADIGSICQIGVVRIVDGVEVAAGSWLCRPPAGIDHFQPGNVAVHGITPDDVADQPTFAERLPQLLEFIGDLPVVAHNAQFDAIATLRACLASDLAVPPLTYGCSLALSRAARLGLSSHRLPVVAQALGVDLAHHHDAASDARAAAMIIVELARRAGHRGDFPLLHQAQGFTLGGLEGDRAWPVLKIRSGTAVAVQERHTEPAPEKQYPEESGEVGGARPGSRWPPRTPSPRRTRTPIPPTRCSGRTSPSRGISSRFDKGQLWQDMAQLGADIGKNVTKKTTILVAGSWATKTSKQKRAEELIAKGQEIDIWSAEQLYAVLGIDPASADTGGTVPEDEHPPF